MVRILSGLIAIAFGVAFPVPASAQWRAADGVTINEVGDPQYILDLLARVVTVSVETVRIVDGLPRLSLD